MSDWKFSLVGRIGAGAVRAIHATCRVTTTGDANWRTHESPEGAGWIACLWHGTMLPPIWRHRDRGAVALVSEHRDGEYITRVMSRLGFGLARGSSTRGGARGLRELLRAGRAGRTLAVTPDGPQGPREVVKPGPVVLASRSGLPIVPLGVGMSRAWRMSSWDRFSVPKPFARVHIRYGAPIRIPRELDEASTETWVRRLQAAMDAATTEARRAAGEVADRRDRLAPSDAPGAGESDR